MKTWKLIEDLGDGAEIISYHKTKKDAEREANQSSLPTRIVKEKQSELDSFVCELVCTAM